MRLWNLFENILSQKEGKRDRKRKKKYRKTMYRCVQNLCIKFYVTESSFVRLLDMPFCIRFIVLNDIELFVYMNRCSITCLNISFEFDRLCMLRSGNRFAFCFFFFTSNGWCLMIVNISRSSKCEIQDDFPSGYIILPARYKSH